MTRSDYQPHIDGLRGIAVLSILLFHLGLPWAKAGFLGVDLFFVISGYLITGQILSLTAKGDFSLGQFYLRRARRLLPALFFTLLISMAAGYVLLSPQEFLLLSRSVLASEFFYSNIYFWLTAGYFADISQSNLLLHTWSLSLEEQFYVVWPILLIFFARLITQPKFILTALLGIGTCSLVASQWAAVHVPEAAFYLLPFRFHEFVVGGLAFVIFSSQSNRLKAVGEEKLTLAGLLLLAFALINLDPRSTLPGFLSLIPVAGIALLLVSAGHSKLGAPLSWEPLRIIGLASYSIYLVHWPLIAFAQKAGFSAAGNLPMALTLLLASLLLGYTSYRWIEQPFRNPERALYQPRLFLPLLIFGFLTLAAAAALTIHREGFPDRFPQALQMSQQELLAERERYWQSFGKNSESRLKINKDNKFVLIIGNSHAQDLVYALRQNAYPNNIEVIITPYKCFNFGQGSDPADDDYCQNARKGVLASPMLARADSIYLHEDFNGEWIADLMGFLAALRGQSEAPIYLFGPRLTFRTSVLQIAHEHGRLSGLREYALSQSFLPEREKLNTKLKEVFRTQKLAEFDIHYLDTLSVQCGKDRQACGVISSETSDFLYFDNSHFTVRGAFEFGLALRAQHPDLFSSLERASPAPESVD